MQVALQIPRGGVVQPQTDFAAVYVGGAAVVGQETFPNIPFVKLHQPLQFLDGDTGGLDGVEPFVNQRVHA